MKSYFGQKLLDGSSTILIQNGKIIESGLKKTKMNINDLLEECRSKNAFNISDIEFAILETNGKLSILLKSPYQPLTPNDMNITTPYKGLCINIIIDGKLLKEHLKMINKDNNWLDNELKKQEITKYSDIILAFVDSSDSLNIQLKDNSSKYPQNLY